MNAPQTAVPRREARRAAVAFATACCALGCFPLPSSAADWQRLPPPDLRIDRATLSYAGAGIALTLWAISRENADQTAAQLDGLPLEGGSDLGNVYGDGAFLAAGTASLWTAGRLAGSAQVTNASVDLARGLAVDGALVWATKLAVGRTRPSGGPHSFPSGHTSTAFTVAPILTHHFGWRVGVPALVLATMTGLGRLEDRRHYVSDVVAGAALGLIVGHAIVGRGSDSEPGAQLVADGRGVGVEIGF